MFTPPVVVIPKSTPKLTVPSFEFGAFRRPLPKPPAVSITTPTLVVFAGAVKTNMSLFMSPNGVAAPSRFIAEVELGAFSDSVRSES
jgi:hypothetical protein